jgi:hypothetical protein
VNLSKSDNLPCFFTCAMEIIFTAFIYIRGLLQRLTIELIIQSLIPSESAKDVSYCDSVC